MNPALRVAVKHRAGARCEYCHLPEACVPFVSFQVEHIVARQHRGPTALGNTAWACARCNLCNGPNLAGIDEVTNAMIKLFNPRKMKWARHFRWEGPVIVGRTAIGRATVNVLQMNDGDRVELRQALLDEGV